MDINERDYEFMLKIKSAFEKSQEGEVGSIRSVAKDFNLSRTKVRKILVTAEHLNILWRQELPSITL